MTSFCIATLLLKYVWTVQIDDDNNNNNNYNNNNYNNGNKYKGYINHIKIFFFLNITLLQNMSDPPNFGRHIGMIVIIGDVT